MEDQASGERTRKLGAQLGVKVMGCGESRDCPTRERVPKLSRCFSCGVVRCTHFPWRKRRNCQECYAQLQ